MDEMKRKQIALIAAALVISIGLGFVFSVHVSAASTPSLFHNDERWYRDTSAGLEIIGGLYYVPVDVFGMFRHLELTMDSRRGEFMVYNRNTGAYISVIYSEKIATINGEEEAYLNLYKLHGGYYYVPAEYFCTVLSLGYEVRRGSGSAAGVTFRILDGNEAKNFDELLEPYDSSSSGSSDTAPPIVTDPPVSDTDVTVRSNYITFNTIQSEPLLQILTTLEKMSVKATFFISEAELRGMPESVVAVCAAGHTVALRCDSAESAEDFLAQMTRANDILYGITKIRTRIAHFPSGKVRDELTDGDWERIAAAGYVLWDWTYDVPDSQGYSVRYVKSACRQAVAKNEINVLRFGCNETAAQVLPDLVSYLMSNSNYRIYPIYISHEEVRFSGK
jgi:peptidoglycan/xylan/chitin deacetylase (PgdA/CDA1 family)